MDGLPHGDHMAIGSGSPSAPLFRQSAPACGEPGARPGVAPALIAEWHDAGTESSRAPNPDLRIEHLGGI